MAEASEKRARILLLSGIPASGKTTYAEWLERHRGVEHIDLEAQAHVRLGLGPDWDRVISTAGSDAAFVEKLRERSSPVALTWGFPPAFLPVIRWLKAQGVECWWLDGDREAARRSFRQAGRSVQDWDRQMAAILSAWPELEAFYEGHQIQTITPGPTYLSCTLLAEQLSLSDVNASRTGD